MRRYGIGVAAELTGMHQQTIRQYERLGLIQPHRSPGGTRYFTDADLERLLTIARLTQDMGVNLAGVEVILRMRDREDRLMDVAQAMFQRLDAETRAHFEHLLGGRRSGLVPASRGRLARLWDED